MHMVSLIFKSKSSAISFRQEEPTQILEGIPLSFANVFQSVNKGIIWSGNDTFRQNIQSE